MVDETPASKPAIASVTATIKAGESLSSAANLTVGSLSVLLTPTEWTPANVSFQISEDNVTFFDLVGDNGVEILRAIQPATAVLIDPSLTQAAMYVKIRSGPRINPVPQEADRIFSLVLV